MKLIDDFTRGPNEPRLVALQHFSTNVLWSVGGDSRQHVVQTCCAWSDTDQRGEKQSDTQTEHTKKKHRTAWFQYKLKTSQRNRAKQISFHGGSFFVRS